MHTLLFHISGGKPHSYIPRITLHILRWHTGTPLHPSPLTFNKQVFYSKGLRTTDPFFCFSSSTVSLILIANEIFVFAVLRGRDFPPGPIAYRPSLFHVVGILGLLRALLVFIHYDFVRVKSILIIRFVTRS